MVPIAAGSGDPVSGVAPVDAVSTLLFTRLRSVPDIRVFPSRSREAQSPPPCVCKVMHFSGGPTSGAPVSSSVPSSQLLFRCPGFGKSAESEVWNAKGSVCQTCSAGAMISCGAHNAYGHPDPWALRFYKAVASEIYRTDLQGHIGITGQRDGSYEVSTERGVPSR